MHDVEGVTSAMMVALGKEGIKTVEDLAGCATDDLIGYSEKKNGETIKTAGILDGFELSRAEAEGIIMAARVKAGWIEAAAADAEATEEAAAAEDETVEETTEG
jgi:N utilization substance protein A